MSRYPATRAKSRDFWLVAAYFPPAAADARAYPAERPRQLRFEFLGAAGGRHPTANGFYPH